GGPPAARRRILRAYAAAEIALQRFHHHHASPFAGRADADGQSDFRAGAASVFRQLETRRAGTVAGSASVESRFGFGFHPAYSAGVSSRRALAEGAGRGGSSARQVW